MTPQELALSLATLAFPDARVSRDEHGTYIIDATGDPKPRPAPQDKKPDADHH